MSKFEQHNAEAIANIAKAAQSLKVGDFVMARDCGLKFDHGDLVCQLRYTDEDSHDRVCLVTRVEEVADGALLDRKALSNWKPQGLEGGAQSDDVPYDKPNAELTTGDYETFYTLAVLVREKTTRRCVLIDPEHYDWPRYVLFRADYAETFGPLVTVAKAEAAREAAQKAAEDAEEALREAVRDAELTAKYAALPCRKSATGFRPYGADVGRNIRAALRQEFPGVKFSVKQDHANYYRVEYTDGPSYESVVAVTSLFRNIGSGADFTEEFGSSDVYLIRHVSSAVIDSAMANYELHGANDAERLRSVKRVLDRTDIPAGQVVTGFDWQGDVRVPVFAAA